jgi:hypothetical protein
VREVRFCTSGTSRQSKLRAGSCPDLPAWKSALTAERMILKHVASHAHTPTIKFHGLDYLFGERVV